VIADGTMLGKPATAEEARAMLLQLRGRPHTVITGVVLRGDVDLEWGAAIGTRVRMRAYTTAEIEQYIARREPFDKAGGYAVQDRLFRPVERLEGCYLNVVGLPLCLVARGLELFGAQLSGPSACVPPCAYCRVYGFSP
jgi:predicted house-cleaning NTP pyrophosphatase (Maf/HAM1 superfamily)